ncbi:MAG: hypothetical protein ACLFTT_13865 [Candidatus Hydrogenedentota bacterium]
MNHVPSRVSAHEARAFFTHRRWRNLFGLLLPHETVSATGVRLPKLEQVWLGYYWIDLRVRIGTTPAVQSISVEGHSGAFALFELHAALRDDPIEGPTFPPAISENEAVQIGREECLKNILRRRSQQKKPAIEETLATSIFYYPYWVWYYARRGRLDMRLMDAYTTGPGGNRTRAGLLSAFVQSRKR